MDVKQLLDQVKTGEVSVSQAEQLLKNLPYEDMGFAKLDHHRELRSGFGEVIFAQGKTPEQVEKIFLSLSKNQRNVLATRANREQYEQVAQSVPQAIFDEVSRTIRMDCVKIEQVGKVVVCTGGTTDIPVAEEAALTAEAFGAKVARIYDVGVAGLHRLLSNLPQIRDANCIVAVAGMEGALPGVVAGLVEVPVVAVPTSIGYGSNFHGLSALLTMLNSCAEGIGVVNIDNGFGGGYLAAQINRLVERKA